MIPTGQSHKIIKNTPLKVKMSKILFLNNFNLKNFVIIQTKKPPENETF